MCGMQICNEGLRLMLKDSSTRELEEYKDKVSNVGANFSKEEDMQGATFAYVLYKMTEHVQVEELHNLQVTKTHLYRPLGGIAGLLICKGGPRTPTL